MVDIAAIVLDLKDASQLLNTRKRLKTSSATNATMENNIVKCVSSKIGTLPFFDASAAMKLYEVLQNTDFSEEGQAFLQTAIDARLTAASVSAPQVAAAKAPSKPQKLLHVDRYLTAADWQTLSSVDNSIQMKTSTLINRLVRLGICSMHEQIAKHVTALHLAPTTCREIRLRPMSCMTTSSV